MNNIIIEIQTVLEQKIDEKTLATSRNYIKVKNKCYGVQVKKRLPL